MMCLGQIGCERRLHIIIESTTPIQYNELIQRVVYQRLVYKGTTVIFFSEYPEALHRRRHGIFLISFYHSFDFVKLFAAS